MPVVQLMMGYQAAGGVSPAAVVTVTPDPSSGDTMFPTPASVSVTASIVGGTGPFTYAWSISSGGAGCTLTDSTLETCTVTTNTGLPQSRSGTLNVDVTDTGNGGLVSSDTGTFNLEVV